MRVNIFRPEPGPAATMIGRLSVPQIAWGSEPATGLPRTPR